MSDKKLLEEGTVRRFMELAKIKPLNTLEEGKKGGSKHEKDESAEKEKKEHGKGHESEKKEKKLEETHAIGDRDGITVAGQTRVSEEEEMGAMGGAEDAGAADMGGGEEAGDEGGDDVKPEVEALVNALNGLLAKVGKKDLEVDVEAGAEGGEGEEAGAEGGEEGGEAEEEEEAVMEAKKKMKKEEGWGMKKEAKKPMKKKKEEEEEGVYESLDLQVEDDEALAEELTRRVAARLVAEMKKAKKAKGMTEDFTGGGTKKATPPKGHGAGGKSFGTKSKGR